MKTIIAFAALAGTFAVRAQGQEPLRYEVQRAARPLAIDGRLDEASWRKAAWSSDFVDILGQNAPAPRYRTRVKMLWDETYLYIGAELQEPDVHGKLQQHDSVIFHDDDFELFLKPVADGEPYFEFEINALNATWDLYLNKPYRFGGKPDSAWEAEGVKTAIAVQGTLNDATDKDRGWTVEIALPLAAFRSRQQVPLPVNGSTWRANFSRVEWLPDHPHDDNWVWSAQGVVNMHVPERWGFLVFRKP